MNPRPSREPEAERQHRKQRLAATFRIFARYGFDEGAGGHVTARDPVYQDHFWVNPLGVHFGQVRVSDLLLVDAGGTVVEGTGTINPAAFAIHSRIHEARPDVVAAAHTHAVHSRAWAALGRPLDPITQDACAFFEDHRVFDEFTGVVLDRGEGARIAARLGPHKAVILRNHGLLTVGGSVEEAAWWFIAFDRCCQVQLLSTAVGQPCLISESAARDTREIIGTPQLARLNFRPLYADVVRREPDLFD